MCTITTRGPAEPRSGEVGGIPKFVHRSFPDVIARACLAIQERKQYESKVLLDGCWQ